ncbi:MAG TPA: hypothetical protein PKC89_09420 [Pyrinomonadaceae bacterium]|nr:hypothetical protein [Pyrinomonadaceae bacterium]
MNDELEPEYDFTQYKVRRVGEGRRLMNQVKLDVDVARVFPDSDAVNEALRTLIRLTEQHRSELPSK